MSVFVNKAEDAVVDLQGNPLLDQAEDLIAEDEADDGGAIADKLRPSRI